jgi:pimeloyl-ACP methyl ester carboxylesterase
VPCESGNRPGLATLSGVSLKEIPHLVAEFRDLAREYVIQQTLGQAKKLGHLVGFSLGAALVWAFAILLLAVAALRGIIALLPEGAYWEALGYTLTVVGLLVLALVIVQLGPKSPDAAPGKDSP